jgi:hypothetical protein
MDPVIVCRAADSPAEIPRAGVAKRIGPYGSNPGKKSRSAVLHCGINRAALMRCDKLRKKMPPSGWKTAPILRVDPALFFMSPSGARAMQQRPSGLGR